MEVETAALQEKLDRLAADIEFIREEAERAARARAARDELLQDLVPIGNDLFRLISEQLEEVQACADLSKLLHLSKRLARNTCLLERILDHLESLMDLTQTLGPITNSVFEKTTNVLEQAERKGYFEVGKRTLRAADEAVAIALRDSSAPPPSLWSLVRRLRDPDVRRGLGLFLGVLGVLGKIQRTE